MSILCASEMRMNLKLPIQIWGQQCDPMQLIILHAWDKEYVNYHKAPRFNHLSGAQEKKFPKASST